MSDAPVETKAILRRQLREVLKNFSPEDRAVGSVQLCQRVRDQTVWQSARSVLLFVPTLNEPDIRPLIAEALACGKNVSLPRYTSANDVYRPCLIRDGSRDLAVGPFGIAEPVPACPIFDAKELDFALIPGLGFSLDGGRLGRGKGYYDRLLTEIPGFKCGVGFDCQITPAVPLESHDVRLNCILTPARWHLVVSQPRF
jgi:5-formyltetrahydrofolate cyclo-ligase